MIEKKSKQLESNKNEEFLRRSTYHTDRFDDTISEVLKENKQTSDHVINSTDPFCRVCLQDQSEGELIRSCACLDPIHKKCLLDWMEHRINITNSFIGRCEICKQPYSIKLEEIYCFTGEICLERYRGDKRWFFCSLVVVLIFLLIAVLTSFLLYKMQRFEEVSIKVQEVLSLPHNTSIALLAMLALFSGVLTIGLAYKLVGQYCYGIKRQINRIEGIR